MSFTDQDNINFANLLIIMLLDSYYCHNSDVLTLLLVGITSMLQNPERQGGCKDIHFPNTAITGRCFDVRSTSFERYGHQMDVETMLCAYWEYDIIIK